MYWGAFGGGVRGGGLIFGTPAWQVQGYLGVETAGVCCVGSLGILGCRGLRLSRPSRNFLVLEGDFTPHTFTSTLSTIMKILV